MASKTDSTRVMWRVQVRKSRKHAWKNKGLYETRRRARDQAAYLRDGIMGCGETLAGTAYGFGNTRVVRHVRGGGR